MMNMVMVIMLMVMVTMVNGDSDESDGNGENDKKPRIVSSQLLKEGPVDGKETTWAFYKCVTYSKEL